MRGDQKGQQRPCRAQKKRNDSKRQTRALSKSSKARRCKSHGAACTAYELRNFAVKLMCWQFMLAPRTAPELLGKSGRAVKNVVRRCLGAVTR